MDKEQELAAAIAGQISNDRVRYFWLKLGEALAAGDVTALAPTDAASTRKRNYKSRS